MIQDCVVECVQDFRNPNLKAAELGHLRLYTVEIVHYLSLFPKGWEW